MTAVNMLRMLGLLIIVFTFHEEQSGHKVTKSTYQTENLIVTEFWMGYISSAGYNV